ncbi:MAG: SDR family NAD(P)-dependent oxidoreductase, partial [Desulfobacteraceae bacterium]|nr:SDR family NAD(P)-dependent oxidoreductase [Desulfobacteraceae bacterium]
MGYNFVDYSQRLMRQNLASEAYSYTGNASPILPARLSYLLNLKGPGIALNTACSSSMVAVHLACDSIRCGTSRLALAGGAQVMTTGQFHVLADSLGMSAKDGKCKTFDHRADGFVPGEAVGVVLLKSLSQARADGDPIHGIIIGSAVNQDGRTNGITAPSAPSQTALACEVYDRFGIHPETIGYVEAHGTGTELGDPIEVQALTDAFGRYTQKRGYCAIGAVKTNIGHTLAAAGVSSLIKTLLCLKYRKRVPSLHFEKPNPHIDFENSPFFVNTRLADWPAPDHGTPRRAAVSSFGFSGTNVHVVLEEFIDDDMAPGRRSSGDARKGGEPQLVVLSAKNDDRLRAYAGRLADFLDRAASGLASPACGLENIAYTLQTGRTAMTERLALVVSRPEELAQQLKRYREGGSEIAGGYFGNTRQNREASAHLLSGKTGRTYVQALMDSRDLAKIARLWVMGADIDWSLLHRGTLPRRCPLPAYPFAKNRYWISDEVPDPPFARQPGDVSQPICFHSVWEEKPLERSRNVTDSGSSGPVLLFEEDEELRSEYEALLKREVIRVTPGNAYAFRKDGSYEIDPADAGHYTRLLAHLKDRGRAPGAWILSGYRSDAKTLEQQLDGLGDFDVVQRNSPVLAVFRFLKAVSAASLDAPLRILFLSRSRGQTADPVAGAVFGYAKPLGFLLPGISFSTVHWLDSGSPVEAVCRELRASTPGHMQEIQYADGVRTVRTVRPLRPKTGTDPKVKNGGVYWITGGAGGLGRIFARYLARTYQARIVLTGRSAVTDAIQAEVDGLSSAGATAVYVQADAGDAAAMTRVMEQVKERFGRLDGVIHAAGISTREVVFHKTEQAFASTLRPKIDGAIVLDRVTRDEPLQFFVLFSSIASVIGDFGQCDYAVGNRFLDRFAELREKARQSGIRSGRTLAVNWPIWRDGGMHQPSEEEAGYLQASGMRYLETEEGLALFESLLDTDPAQVLVMAGDRDRIRRILAPGTDPSRPEPRKAPAREIDAGHPASLDPLAALEQDIARMAAKLLKLDLHEMDVEERFGNFGFDSLSLKKLGDRLGERFPIELSPAVFFANSSIRKLARFLIQTHEAEIRSAYAASAAAPAGPWGEEDPGGNPAAAEARVAPEPRASAEAGDPSGRAVAIIGMHGMFPGSRDVNEFWEHLAAGRDLISEFPEGRWNRRGDSDAVWTGSGPFPRWGGFLSDVDKFDPLFFKISPREAEMMDPQHRLFLETVWKTLEDAGYRPSSLSGKAVGIYAGIQFNDYEHLLLFSGQSNPQAATGTAAAMLANRISFLMNWHGPSESVVTACSSSLVAVHHAVASLRNGESELAVAGGVSLILYPGQLIGAHRLGVLSPEGRCKTFDAGANGYVKGEGVGAVLLKP